MKILLTHYAAKLFSVPMDLMPWRLPFRLEWFAVLDQTL